MMLQVFEHNAKAYQAAVKMLQQYGKTAIVHPTGTGKSYIAFKLIEDHPDAVILWLSPSEYIFKTQRESLLRQDPDFPLQNVHFYTYAKLMCCTPAQLQEIAAQDPAYILLDEFHRAGAEYWGDSTQKLLALCPQSKLLGLTATNVRYLDNNRDMAEELFDGHIASEMSLGEAIVRGILPAPKYVTTVFRYQQDLARYLSIGHPIAAVCIRTSTERPEALEAGNFILAGITTRKLLNATDMAIEMKQKGVLGKPCPDYVDETVSMKVVRIIQGYVNVVNKMVWRKY